MFASSPLNRSHISGRRPKMPPAAYNMQCKCMHEIHVTGESEQQ